MTFGCDSRRAAHADDLGGDELLRTTPASAPGPPIAANAFMSMTFCASACAAVASVGPPVASIVTIFSLRPYVSETSSNIFR